MSDLTPAGAPLPAIAPDEIGFRSLPPSMAIMLNPHLYERAKAIAVVMSRAEGLTPKHLIGQGEACFSVVTMALDWKLSWHFVARHTYQTPNGSIGFDGALVQSILEASGKFIGSPGFEYRGDWRVLTGKFRMQAGQRGGQYPVATWTDQDATGLGVIVRWTVRGESTPRVWPGDDEPFWLVQCQPRNSPLWATDPKTQIRYLAIRRFGNMAAPGILGGASFDQEELIEAADLARDITPTREPRPEDFQSDGRSQVQVSDVEPERFEVVALDGEIFTFETPDGALGALRTVLEGGRRGGAKMLDAAIENNQALLDQLAEGAELLAEYRPAPASSGDRTETPAPASTDGTTPGREAPPPQERTAAPQASEASAPAPRPTEPEQAASAPAPPAAAVDDDRFPGDLPAGERLGGGPSTPAQAQEQRRDPTPPADARPAMPASSPPAGTPANGGQPPSGNGPTATSAASRSEPPAEPAGERKSMLIPPPLSRGRPDWRTWIRALLIPKIRQQTTSDDLAFLLGDNQAHLESARGALDRQDLAELDAVIEAAWARLRP